ncbi:MAG TPA: hypothetical protein ENK57_15945, partial [Polyangiaceae bacterium]|nr:hypothetical protein [Polyangiaceae bacterium]
MPSDATLGPFRVLRPVPPEAGLGPNVSVAEWGGDGEHAGERVLLHHYEAKGLGRARAFRELGQAKDLRHRALAKVHGWYEEDGALVAVLEHVEGARLDQIVGHLAEQGARLGDDAIAELSLLIAEAVAHAQEAKDGRGRGLKLVHGTLATDRVVLGWDGRVKIYGTALRSLYVGEGRTKAMRAYTAPELRGGSHGTSRGDVFALGMIMWTLYTGRIPEPHGPPPEKIGRFRPDLDDALKRCIDTAVKRVALERRVTCRGIAQLLQTIVTTDTLASEVKAFADLGLDLDQPYAEPVLPDDDEEDVATLPPSVSEPPDDEDRLRMPTPPGVSEDSTIERLSDLFDTLEVGSEEPAPDSTTDEGWLVDVVRKSSPEFLAAQVPDNKATPTKPASKKEPDEDAKPKEPPPPP